MRPKLGFALGLASTTPAAPNRVANGAFGTDLSGWRVDASLTAPARAPLDIDPRPSPVSARVIRTPADGTDRISHSCSAFR